MIESSSEAPVRRARAGRRLRWWIVSTVLYASALLALTGWLLPPDWRKLGYYALYMSVSNSLLPLAVNPPTVALGAIYSPWTVAVVGALATCYANFSEFVILGPLLGHRRADVVKKTKIYKRFLALFQKAPRLSVMTASFLPLPVDPIRFTAIASGFSTQRYLAYDAIGRFCRYLLLATVGDVFQDSRGPLIAIVVLLLVVPPLVPWLLRKRAERRQQHAQQQQSQDSCSSPSTSTLPSRTSR
jgi:uncharacterized membrane protein YdjX (TVP38/TMEM64 family)